MYFDALTLSAITDELQAKVLGGRIQEIVLAAALTLGLEVYLHPIRHYLVISAHPQLARIHLTRAKVRRGIEAATPFLLLLRRYVREARLIEVRQVPFERILRLGFENNTLGPTTLVVEIMGRHSNLILLDQEDIIIDSIKRVGAEVNRYRLILPHQPYVAPPVQPKCSPHLLTASRLHEILTVSSVDTPAWRALVDGIRGMSPLLAKELVFRTYGDAEIAAVNITTTAPLLRQLATLVIPETRAPWEPSVGLANETISAFAPYALTHWQTFRRTETVSEAIEKYVTTQTTADPYGAAKRRVATTIEESLRALERKREALQRRLISGEEIERLRTSGEMLLAYGHQLQPGQATLKVETAPSEPPLEIALDPRLSVSDNAQNYFERYRRAQKATQEVPAMLEKIELAIRYLRQLALDLELATNAPEIEEVRTALREAGYLREPCKRTAMTVSKPLSLKSVDGFTILVGKNSRQNDEITFHRAAGFDLWFHARGVPGAHVIIQTEGKTVPETTIQQAAALAAHFSAARAEKTAAVDYTQCKYVRRIKGAPGLVTYSRETTLRVAPKGP